MAIGGPSLALACSCWHDCRRVVLVAAAMTSRRGRTAVLATVMVVVVVVVVGAWFLVADPHAQQCACPSTTLPGITPVILTTLLPLPTPHPQIQQSCC